jgi:hypothetical protein
MFLLLLIPPPPQRLLRLLLLLLLPPIFLCRLVSKLGWKQTITNFGFKKLESQLSQKRLFMGKIVQQLTRFGPLFNAQGWRQ